MEEINKLGFSKDDQVVLHADKEIVTIKKLSSQGHSMFLSQCRKPKVSVDEEKHFSGENKFRDFACPIWEEAQKDKLTLQDIDEMQ